MLILSIMLFVLSFIVAIGFFIVLILNDFVNPKIELNDVNEKYVNKDAEKDIFEAVYYNKEKYQITIVRKGDVKHVLMSLITKKYNKRKQTVYNLDFTGGSAIVLPVEDIEAYYILAHKVDSKKVKNPIPTFNIIPAVIYGIVCSITPIIAGFCFSVYGALNLWYPNPGYIVTYVLSILLPPLLIVLPPILVYVLTHFLKYHSTGSKQVETNISDVLIGAELATDEVKVETTTLVEEEKEVL